ncbi:hypothetical protein DPMN_087537 [Dreissena polymorpha]|uniref:Peptidase A2 domain-containing protein n=1 Tax=Dreissena polymorpha TaxID=45954 RepID=A0A9D4KU46_DREPO|nr:hypothetical protein DPMN_087537 [Dreissena polymorpha]
MKVQVGDVVVNAVVDLAAEVSIISDRVYQAIKRPPPKLRDVKLLTAGRKLSMQGSVVGPVKLKIGNYWYKEQLYEAPIDTNMLLGFDILVNRGRSILNMADATLIFGGQTINLDIGSTDGQTRVAEVRVGKRRVIPPNSVVQLKCTMRRYDVDYIVESFSNSKLLIPRVVRSAGSDPVLCLVNPTDRFRLLKKNALIARAFPVA